MMENNDFWNMNDGMEERIKSFEDKLASGDSFFYDNDELGQIIDYYLDFEEISKANNAIKYAESIYPFETFYKIKKAEVYIAKRNISGAIKLLEKYRTVEPQNTEIAKLLGDCYAISLQLKKANECYLFALNNDLENDELLLRLARVSMALGNAKKAFTYLNAFPKDFIYDDLSIQEIVKLYLDYGHSTEGIAFLEKRIDEQPYWYAPWYFTGVIHQKEEDYDKAINAYEFCIAIDESNTMGHLGKGNSLMELKRYEEAVTYFNLSLDNDETDAEVLCNIAECYENLNDLPSAKKHYLKSITTNPNLSDAYFGLATVYKEELNWPEAERNLHKAIGIDQYESMYHIELAEVYLLKENKDACYHHYQLAYDLDTDTTEIILDFSHAKFEFGDIQKAIDLLLENLDGHAMDHRMYYRIASYAFTLGNFEQGYNYLHLALNINTDEYMLLYEFAPFLENLDNVSNIIDLYLK